MAERLQIHGRAVKGVGLRRLVAGIAGSNPTGSLMSVVSVVCCQVDVCTMGRSLVQRSRTGCVCVMECDQVQQ